jgi:hypothetical protein
MNWTYRVLAAVLTLCTRYVSNRAPSVYDQAEPPGRGAQVQDCVEVPAPEPVKTPGLAKLVNR